MSSNPLSHQVSAGENSTTKSRRSARHQQKSKAVRAPVLQSRMSLPTCSQSDCRAPGLLSSTSYYEVCAETEPSSVLLPVSTLTPSESPAKKKKHWKRNHHKREEVKTNEQVTRLDTAPDSQMNLYEELETGAVDSNAGIPQVGSNLPTLSDSDEEDGPPPALFAKDSRLTYDPSFILSLRNDPQSIIIPDPLEPIWRREIRPIRGEPHLYEFPRSPVIKPADPPADISTWRRGETDEEKKINEQAKVQTERLKAEKTGFEVIQRSIKVTLNKLSPDNFPKLRDQLLDLAKNSDETMVLLAKFIFEKAILQQKYTEVYAKLCQYVDNYYASMHTRAEEGRKNVRNTQKFRELLLGMCQEAFDCSMLPEAAPVVSGEDLETYLTVKRLKCLGNMRFIGELYKHGLVTITTVLHISRELIDSRLPFEAVEISALVLHEDHLECVNVLLETVQGKFKPGSKVKAMVGLIFETLERIVAERGDVSMKVRFRLMVRAMQNLVEEQKRLESLDKSQEQG